MLDLQPIVTDSQPRPKRKYTVTERVLAACCANLERANAVPREIRFRCTEKRRRACRHNLTLALIAKKRDRSPRYATCFRNGWYVADPERALALVGATAEEYRCHLAAWRREINPQDSTEEKLAHAIGMLSWRWIAGVRLECDLETLRVYRALQALAEARRLGGAGPGGPGIRASSVTFNLTGVDPRSAPAGEGLLPVTPEQLTWLGYELDDALSGCVRLEAPLGRISGRMLRLWQELLCRRGEPLLDLKTAGFGSRGQRVAISHEMHSPYELAEPFDSCSRTQAALCADPKELPPAEQRATSSEVDSQQSRVENQQSTVDSPPSTVERQRATRTALEPGAPSARRTGPMGLTGPSFTRFAHPIWPCCGRRGAWDGSCRAASKDSSAWCRRPSGIL